MNNPRTSRIEDIYELSPMQLGMLFDCLAVNNHGMYLVRMSYNLEGKVDLTAFRRAWRETANRHPVLRSSIHHDGLDAPVQVVHTQVDLPIENIDLRGLSQNDQETRVRQYVDEETNGQFRLDAAPLMKLRLFQTGERTYWFVWIIHHILVEGWSTAIILDEVLEIYAGLLEGKPRHLQPVGPYRDFLLWIQQQDGKEAETFWRHQLRGFTSPTPLPNAHGDVKKNSAVLEFESKHFSLSETETAALQKFARHQKLTLSTLIRAVWAFLLSRYSGEEDVLFGTLVSGRSIPLEGVESIVGLFINLVPVRIKVDFCQPLSDLLSSLQKQQTEITHYEYCSFAQIKAWSEVSGSLPLFESLLIFENWIGDITDWKGLFKLRDTSADQVGQGYPITVVVEPGSELKVAMLYDEARFTHATVERLLEHFKKVLLALPGSVREPVGKLPLLASVDERALFPREGNRSSAAPDIPVHKLFEAQVAQRPHAVAVTCAGESLTYEELNMRADRLAALLRNHGVKANTLVGVMLERSVEMIVGVLGILKSGGAYVPLDPLYPARRISFIVEDAAIPVLVTQRGVAANYKTEDLRVIFVEDSAVGQSEPHFADAVLQPASEVATTDLAYVVYTSGTAGKPKGTMVSHSNLASAYIAWETAYRLRTEVRTHLQMASLSFDVFSGDMVRALCSGGKLVVAPHELLFTPDKLYGLMRTEDVDCAEFVPAVFRELILYLERSQQTLDFMRLIIVGSDSWYGNEFAQALHYCGSDTRLINSYGMTEATIDSTFFEGTMANPPEGGLVPIGRPLSNTRIYIVDQHLNPVPIGAPGEICVAGHGVAAGYLNQPQLTSDKFVDNPFADKPGSKLYRSGDLGRMLSDGNIELLGRIDKQVKIRGFRVETGEIENVLSRYPGVNENAVVLRQVGRGDNRLIAYVAAEPSAVPTAAALRHYLRSEVPDYMVPSSFVFLDQLPRSPNNKIDTDALPAPDETRQLGQDYIAHETETERKLVEIWQNVLGQQPIGTQDNFFDLGGHSLLLMRLHAQITEQFEFRLPFRVLFNHPTIKEQALLMDAIGDVQAVPVQRSENREEYIL